MVLFYWVLIGKEKGMFWFNLFVVFVGMVLLSDCLAFDSMQRSCWICVSRAQFGSWNFILRLGVYFFGTSGRCFMVLGVAV